MTRPEYLVMVKDEMEEKETMVNLDEEKEEVETTLINTMMRDRWV